MKSLKTNIRKQANIRDQERVYIIGKSDEINWKNEKKLKL